MQSVGYGNRTWKLAANPVSNFHGSESGHCRTGVLQSHWITAHIPHAKPHSLQTLHFKLRNHYQVTIGKTTGNDWVPAVARFKQKSPALIPWKDYITQSGMSSFRWNLSRPVYSCSDQRQMAGRKEMSSCLWRVRRRTKLHGHVLLKWHDLYLFYTWFHAFGKWLFWSVKLDPSSATCHKDLEWIPAGSTGLVYVPIM